MRRADGAEVQARWHLLFWFDDASQVEELCGSVRGKKVHDCEQAAFALQNIFERGTPAAKLTIKHLLQESDLDSNVRSVIDTEATARLRCD